MNIIYTIARYEFIDKDKFLVGFNNKFFIYWYDSNIDALKFDTFKEAHLVNNS